MTDKELFERIARALSQKYDIEVTDRKEGVTHFWARVLIPEIAAALREREPQEVDAADKWGGINLWGNKPATQPAPQPSTEASKELDDAIRAVYEFRPERDIPGGKESK